MESYRTRAISKSNYHFASNTSLWDFDKAYIYTLKLISRQACSLGRLNEKLATKTSIENRKAIIETIQREQLLDDTKLCKDTSVMWVQKNPISKVQLIKKLNYYGFTKQDISYALKEIEELFANQDLLFIGGLTLETIKLALEDKTRKIVKFTTDPSNNDEVLEGFNFDNIKTFSINKNPKTHIKCLHLAQQEQLSSQSIKDTAEYYIKSLNIWDMLALASCIMMIQNNNALNYTTIHRRLQLRAYSCNAALSNAIHKILQNYSI